MLFNFVAPCYFGLEKAAAFDFARAGAQAVRITDGRIAFSGDERVLANANLWSRCAERVMIHLASFEAPDFDALFDGVHAVPWEDYLPKTARFPVKGSSLSSTLSSVPACQSIVKKAIVERMRRGHGVQFLPERGDEYRIRFSIRKNLAEVFLDTSGEGLHKRGYRRQAGIAPLKETLAAAMADFARVREDSLVQDPLCGSGTTVIEAALKARNMAPGLGRPFAAEKYAFLPRGVFAESRERAAREARPNAPFAGMGFDIDPGMAALAQANAKKAGVGDCCRFAVSDVKNFVPGGAALLLANPPYGERMADEKQAAEVAAALGRACAASKPKGTYVITADGGFERHFGRPASKRRKVYNGMIPCQVYMYY